MVVSTSVGYYGAVGLIRVFLRRGSLLSSLGATDRLFRGKLMHWPESYANMINNKLKKLDFVIICVTLENLSTLTL